MEQLVYECQSVNASKKANCFLGCIRSVASKPREGTVPLCSVLAGPPLEPCVQLWGPSTIRSGAYLG